MYSLLSSAPFSISCRYWMLKFNDVISFYKNKRVSVNNIRWFQKINLVWDSNVINERPSTSNAWEKGRGEKKNPYEIMREYENRTRKGFPLKSECKNVLRDKRMATERALLNYFRRSILFRKKKIIKKWNQEKENKKCPNRQRWINVIFLRQMRAQVKNVVQVGVTKKNTFGCFDYFCVERENTPNNTGFNNN